MLHATCCCDHKRSQDQRKFTLPLPLSFLQVYTVRRTVSGERTTSSVLTGGINFGKADLNSSRSCCIHRQASREWDRLRGASASAHWMYGRDKEVTPFILQSKWLCRHCGRALMQRASNRRPHPCIHLRGPNAFDAQAW